MPDSMFELMLAQLPNFAGLLICIIVLYRQNVALFELLKRKCIWTPDAPSDALQGSASHIEDEKGPATHAGPE